MDKYNSASVFDDAHSKNEPVAQFAHLTSAKEWAQQRADETFRSFKLVHYTEGRVPHLLTISPAQETSFDDSPKGHETVHSFDDDSIVPNPR